MLGEQQRDHHRTVTGGLRSLDEHLGLGLIEGIRKIEPHDERRPYRRDLSARLIRYNVSHVRCPPPLILELGQSDRLVPRRVAAEILESESLVVDTSLGELERLHLEERTRKG
ncbi:hypothetical protein GCM10009773_18620 [Williamsia serinedens]